MDTTRLLQVLEGSVSPGKKRTYLVQMSVEFNLAADSEEQAEAMAQRHVVEAVKSGDFGVFDVSITKK